ncbi:MAG: hypothetical protein H0T46_29905 [Deltaproteobacteria bacterium]|nr:hypothetical protein [Deltaproteobacteria bacterium]
MRILYAVMCVLLASTAIARAQTPAADAKALIAEAKQLLKAKQIAEACDKLEAAEKLVESPATELAIADCREKNAQLASAYTWLLKVGAASGGKEAKRAANARWRAKKLEAKLFYLTIEVPAERRIFQLSVMRDDKMIDDATWGQRIPVDAGTYTIYARAPGRKEWSQSITIEKREQVVEVPALDELPLPPPPPPPRTIARSPRSTGRQYKVTTIAATVIGVGGLGLGIGMALRARSLAADSDKICPNTACLDPRGLDLNKRARTSATIANVGFVVGGVAIVGAAVLWWVGRPQRSEEKLAITPAIGDGEAGVVIGGTW